MYLYMYIYNIYIHIFYIYIYFSALRSGFKPDSVHWIKS